MNPIDVFCSHSVTDIYYQLLLPSTLWTGLTIDYDTNLPELSAKSLLDLCLDKLISDEFYVRHISGRIPTFLHSLLLTKAFNQGRVLSITSLMKQYAGQSFAFPVPNSLTNWSVFLFKPSELNILLRPVVSSTPAAMKTFFENSNSHLQTLDMSQVFIPIHLLKTVLPIFGRDSPLNRSIFLPQKTYTLKAGLVAINAEDITVLSDIKRASLMNKYINLEITALHAYSLNNADQIKELFCMMDPKELLNFSLELSNLKLIGFIPELQRFYNLQTLSLSYLIDRNLDTNILIMFASALNSFVHLKQLCLRGSCLSNILRKLLKNDCDQKYTCTRNNNSHIRCCILHRGKLEYLDLSSCRLREDDILVLQEFSFARSLKCLNLKGNSFDVSSLACLIEKIGSSLVVLDIENCIQPGVQLKPLFSKFENLINVKSINMRELYVSVEDITSLLKVLEKMPELRQIALSKTDVFSEFSGKFEKLKCKKQLKILWSQAKLNIQPQQHEM